MTVAVGDPDLPPEAMLTVWQGFIDEKFPLGMWVEETDRDRDPYLLLSVLVTRLDGEYPVMLGYDYLSELDFTMEVKSWEEHLDGESYVAAVQLADRPVELRSAVPDVMRTPEAAAQRRFQRRAMESMSRAAGEARLHELLGGGTRAEADVAAAAAAEDVIAASMVHVPAHRRRGPGGVVDVDDYWYDRASGRRVPGPVARSRSPRSVERARGTTRSAQRPGVASAYQRPSRLSAIEPMDDEVAAFRERRAHELLDSAVKGGFSTDSMYATTDEFGHKQWSPERAFQHEQIVAAFLARSAKVPRERKGLVAGGLPGAGKTSSMEKISEIKRDDYMVLNPDDVKEEMARRGMIPFVDGLTPMEASPLVHQEAGAIVDALAAQALAEGVNVMWDITLANKQTANWVMNSMKKADYEQVDAVFVRVEPQTSRRRVLSRWRALADSWNAGDPKSNGGRLVPDDVVQRSARAGGGTVNEEVFNEVAGMFTNWWRYDNNEDGRAPLLVDSSVAPGGEGS